MLHDIDVNMHDLQKTKNHFKQGNCLPTMNAPITIKNWITTKNIYKLTVYLIETNSKIARLFNICPKVMI